MSTARFVVYLGVLLGATALLSILIVTFGGKSL